MNIKELRIFTGQTQKEFAARFGIPVGTLRRWEYGESTPAPYILKLIKEQLPVNKETLKKIETAEGTYYYDAEANAFMDAAGNRICVHEKIDGVKEQNLALYVASLFEEYYEAVERFERDCRLDKQEDILWG